MIDEDAKSVSIDGRRNNNEHAQGMYIYLVAFRETNTNAIQHYETIVITIKYSVKRPPKKKRININLPWSLWLKKNKTNLPFPVEDIDS